MRDLLFCMTQRSPLCCHSHGNRHCILLFYGTYIYITNSAVSENPVHFVCIAKQIAQADHTCRSVMLLEMKISLLPIYIFDIPRVIVSQDVCTLRNLNAAGILAQVYLGLIWPDEATPGPTLSEHCKAMVVIILSRCTGCCWESSQIPPRRN